MHCAKARICLVSILLAGMAVPASAQQQDPRHWDPSQNDPSLALLREVFGNLVDYVAGGGAATNLASNNTVIAAGFEIFNVAVLFLAMIFVAYSTIKHVLEMGADGEFLKGSARSANLPLRTIGGSAVLLPLAGGYNLIQVMMMWLALQGVGITERAWVAMLERIDQSGMINHPTVPSARPLVASILRNEVCRQSMNQAYAAAGRPDRITIARTTTYREMTVPTDSLVPGDDPIVGGGVGGIGAVPGMGGIVGGTAATASAFGLNYKNVRVPITNYRWAASNGSYLAQDAAICGEVTWEQNPESKWGGAGEATFLDVSSIHKAHSAAVERIINSMSAVATSIVAGGKPSPDVIASAAYEYENQLRDAAVAVVKNENSSKRNRFVEFAKKSGWINAGAYYNHIIMLNDAVQRSINSVPTASPTEISDKETSEMLVNYTDAMTVVEEFLANPSHAVRDAYSAELGDDCSAIPKNWEELSGCISKPTLWAIDGVTRRMAGSNISHITQVKGIGDVLMAASWANIAALGITSGFAGSQGAEYTVGLAWSAKTALSQLGFYISTLSLLLLGAGAVMSFYVPMIPFVAWIAGVIKWVVSVGEAMVAAPIFAAAHIHPEGDDITGKAAPGYMLILSLVMRPVLMLFGLILSIGIAQPVAHLINGGFMFAIKGAMHGSANGLGALAAFAIIYGIVMTVLLHSVFALINYIPDNTFRWMGHAIGMGGIADSEGREAQQHFTVAAGQSRQMMAGKGPADKGPSHPNAGGGRSGGAATSEADHHQGGGPSSGGGD
ncbi:DotA/TraY family protein [Stenotrophomonas maltophilia]|uniref:DotA/TraY family protein n=1 Tax=Stenotrophomonas maltophilia TaxID=40324 RepID=UPI000B4C858D|nr:DotA/TraY family protein [Stenotrophomonas maltophilia]OWQ61355.1 conjugal transfer protein TraY [Stenotrophomonas maltophilia]